MNKPPLFVITAPPTICAGEMAKHFIEKEYNYNDACDYNLQNTFVVGISDRTLRLMHPLTTEISLGEFHHLRNKFLVLEATRSYTLAIDKASIDFNLNLPANKISSPILILNNHGFNLIKTIFPGNCFSIFLMPDNIDLYFENLEKSGLLYSYSAAAPTMSSVKNELTHAYKYDNVISVSTSLLFDPIATEVMEKLLIDTSKSYFNTLSLAKSHYTNKKPSSESYYDK
jgi:hypothetical protein